MAEVTLLTNGGPHPPEKWAILTGNQIAGLIVIDEGSISSEASLARKAKPRFAIDIADDLEAIFVAVADAERDHVEDGSVTVRHAPFNVEQSADNGVNLVESIASKTVFSALLASDEARDCVRNIMKQNLIDAANIARSWALDAKGL